MLHRSEPCRCRFSIFVEKLNFSFGRQKANMAQLSFVSYRTQEMIFNTNHHNTTCLDKNRNKYKHSKLFSITNFLKGYFENFKKLLEKLIFSKKSLEILDWNTIIPHWKNTQKLTQIQDPMTFWPKLARKSNVRRYPDFWYHLRKWLDYLRLGATIG